VPKYVPLDAAEYPRFTGIKTFMRLPYLDRPEDVDFVILGVPFDTGATYRVGARFGPEAIRNVSVMLRPYNPAQDIEVFDHLSGADLGDVAVVPGYIEESYRRIELAVNRVLDAGVTPVLLGGDHSITLAHLRAVAARFGPPCLVQFDSHSDTWDQYFGQRYTHGTPFRRAVEEGVVDPHHSVQVGMRGSLYSSRDLREAEELGYKVVTMAEVRQLGIQGTLEVIRSRVGARPVFISFDIDFIDPAFAPGTGTPEVGGPATWEALELVRGLRGIRMVACDVVEVMPAYDGPGSVTALAAANIAYELITLIALANKGGSST
jgi:agmatinase